MANKRTEILYGEGAPSNNDWDYVARVEEVVPDQGYGLPDPNTVHLFKVEPRLSDRKDFDDWHMMVKKILEGLNMEHLIDKRIKRPRRNDRNALRWRDLSKRACAWLVAGIDMQLLQDVHTIESIVWADDMMTEVVRFLKGEGFGTSATVIMQVFNTRREDFNSPKEFMDSVKSQYRVIRDLEPMFPPYQILIIMYTQLIKTPEFAHHVDLKITDMNNAKKIDWDLTEAELYSFMEAMYDKIKLLMP